MKFKLNPDFLIDTESSPWKTEGLRIGLWGGSGSGKSNTAALFAEQFLSQAGVVVVFEPRAEYHTLKEKFDIVVCGGPYGKDLDFVPSSPATYAKAVVEQGVSIIFYTSDVEDETKLIEFISKFIRYLLKYNEVAKRPIMLITEETEEYAPLNTRGRVSPPWVFSRMIRQFKTAARDARKLNIVTVNMSPRPQEVNFTIRQLCNLTLFGKFSPQDAGYVDRECLKAFREKGVSFYKGSDLLDLKTGQFAVIMSGRSIPLQTITEPRMTKHGAVTPKLEYTAPRTEQTKKAVTSLTKTIKEALEKEKAKEDEITQYKRKLKHFTDELDKKQQEIDRLHSALEVAGVIKIESPEGVSTSEYTQVKAERDKLLEDLKTVVQDIKQDVLAVFNDYSTTPPSTPVKATHDLYKIWEPKIPYKSGKRIFKFLLDHTGTKFSKSEIAVKLGYSSRSGSFNTSIGFLKRNHLIKTDGQFFWVE